MTNLHWKQLQCGHIRRCDEAAGNFVRMTNTNSSIYTNQCDEAIFVSLTKLFFWVWCFAGGSGPSGAKAAMKLITGIDLGAARKPLPQMSTEDIAALARDLEKAGFALNDSKPQ